jgi:predicted TPR repeat methyltransferase
MTDEHAHIRSYFDGGAAAFDRLYTSRSWRGALDRALRPSVYRRLSLALELWRSLDRPEVLDLGSGTARTALALCDAGARQVTAVEFAPAMVAQARALVAASPHGERLTLVEADFLTWQPGRRWPLVIALGVFEYFRDLRAVLARAKDLVAADGTIAFTVRRFTALRGSVRAVRYRLAGCPIYFATRRSITKACREAGFVHVDIRDGGAGSYWVVARVTAADASRPIDR